MVSTRSQVKGGTTDTPLTEGEVGQEIWTNPEEGKHQPQLSSVS